MDAPVNDRPMLALSFLQPWIWSIVEGHKGFIMRDGAFYAIENRKWRPHAKMIGQRFALHASAGYDKVGWLNVLQSRGITDYGAAARECVMRSAIVGSARLVGAMPVAFESLRVRPDGTPVGSLTDKMQGCVLTSPWSFGPWCWVLADVRKLTEPIPCKGALGFWKVPDDITEIVRAREAA